MEDRGYWDAVEPIWKQVSIHHGADAFLSAFRKLPQAVGDLYAAHWLVSEVANGGFPQFFSNSTGVLAPEAVAALRRIGLEESAEIVEAAMSWFDDPYPRDREVRGEEIDWIWGAELSEDEKYNRTLMLDLSGGFLDSLGKEEERFVAAADAYAKRHVWSA